MRKVRVLFALLTVTLLVMTGCDEESLTADTNTIMLTEEDGIIGYIAEDFDEDRYSGEDLRSMIDSEIDDYNATASSASVSLSEYQVGDGMVRAALVYGDAQDYSRFNNVIFFYGTIEEALASDEDFDFGITLKSAEDEDVTISGAEIRDMSESYILITEDASNIRGYRKVAYLGVSDTLVNSREVAVDAREELHYVIFQ